MERDSMVPEMRESRVKEKCGTRKEREKTDYGDGKKMPKKEIKFMRVLISVKKVIL